MAGAHRSASSASRRPTVRILAALFAGSAVMFAAAVVVPGGSLFAGDSGVVAGSGSDGTVTSPSSEIAAAPPSGPPRTTEDDRQPVSAWQSEGTAAGPSPAKTSARAVPSVPGEAAGQTVQWAPDTPPDWATSLRESLAQQAPTQAEPAPTPAAQNPPTADDADESGDDVVEDLLGNLDAES